MQEKVKAPGTIPSPEWLQCENNALCAAEKAEQESSPWVTASPGSGGGGRRSICSFPKTPAAGAASLSQARSQEELRCGSCCLRMLWRPEAWKKAENF